MIGPLKKVFQLKKCTFLLSSLKIWNPHTPHLATTPFLIEMQSFKRNRRKMIFLNPSHLNALLNEIFNFHFWMPQSLWTFAIKVLQSSLANILFLLFNAVLASKTIQRCSTGWFAVRRIRRTSTTPSTCSSGSKTGGPGPTSKSITRWTTNESRNTI